MSSFLVLDCETSGLDPATSGVVELAAVLVADGLLTAEWSSLCHPGEDRLTSAAHVKALEVSGITVAELADAPPVAAALAALDAWASAQGLAHPLPATSYNVAFDRGFLEAAGGADRFSWRRCIMREARRVLWTAGVNRFPSLQGACAKLGIVPEESHRALADARSAAHCALALAQWERRAHVAGVLPRNWPKGGWAGGK